MQFKVLNMLMSVRGETIKRVFVEGYTDDYGDTIENWEISAWRAREVARILENNGIDSSNILATGFGEFWPKYDNETYQSRIKNRRVEIIMVK